MPALITSTKRLGYRQQEHDWIGHTGLEEESSIIASDAEAGNICHSRKSVPKKNEEKGGNLIYVVIDRF
jgi:hypothetical protein